MSIKLTFPKVALDMAYQDILRSSVTKKMVGSYFRLKKSIPRSFLAFQYLRGQGIEIGALHNPVPMHPWARVKYVDRMSIADLTREYPELSNLKLVEPDIIDNGEELSSIADNSLNFVIANHFIEHCEDPIQTIKNFTQKVQPKGLLYLAVPDKRKTFDYKRLSTSFEHLIQDHEQGPENSRVEHYREWVQYFGPHGEDIKAHATALMEKAYSIHFHVWTQSEFQQFLEKTIFRYQLPLRIETCKVIADEAVFIIRKLEYRPS